jgi:hydrogenase nickel incorporation protein HypA/HybF
MHELAIVHGIVDAVTSRCEGDRILRVVVEVGRMTAVLPDALRFCFDVAAQGTAAEGASLDIVETEGDGLRVREMEVA